MSLNDNNVNNNGNFEYLSLLKNRNKGNTPRYDERNVMQECEQSKCL